VRGKDKTDWIDWRLKWIEWYIGQQLEQQLANAYFVDPELRIEKRTGMYCQDGVTEKEYFCLEVHVNRVTERLGVFSVEDKGCSHLWGCYGTPIYAIVPVEDAPVVGTSCMYVLPPGKTYVIAYERRGANPLIKVKKFRVTDPDHAEVLEEWSCEGYQCIAPDFSGFIDVDDVVKRMCEGGGKA
jgi:hypothetical protein